ncbi:DUF4301 family protein [Alistipes sp. OttesenSCG-928-B03]|nr:DUF4301 family protein [Alistipes sp. OttesenSCG-928-B03]
MKTAFSEKELSQIAAHGLDPAAVESQMENFRCGFPHLPIVRPATTGDGIMAVDAKVAELFTRIYREAAPQLRIVKFVPASGAATRMFKNLFEYVRTGEADASTEKTVGEVERFAFYDIIQNKVAGMDSRAVAQAVLDYGARLPKGLIVFHRYADEVRTAVEEHLVEGAQYAASGERVAIHFTVSPEHEAGFRELLAAVQEKYEKRFGVRYDISFSRQDPATDTIAATADNEPFRTDDGKLLFRPAGHGALIGNLGAIDADVVFIKNIDNVTTDRLRGDTIVYKHALAGILLDVRKKIYNYLAILDRGIDDTVVGNIEAFVRRELFVELPDGFGAMAMDEKAALLRRILDRPLRVCAMVRNEGEPGGGPFWVANADGTRSLQIAELSQIAPEKRRLLAEGTHFNPVDIVCATKDYKGRPYDLHAFTDPATGFVSEKSQGGRTLRALELPGLWNGAMARWNTVFVEAPVATFTPVKEVNDLLRAQHQ